MATQNVRSRRRPWARRGRLVAAAALGLATLVVWVVTTIGPATTPGPIRGTGPEPDVDRVLDLTTGTATALPGTILGSLSGDRSGTPGLWHSQYAASPDGSRLAYLGEGAGGNLQIFIANIDGSQVHQATHDAGGAEAPAWSPDGTKIAYVSGRPGMGALALIDVATGESVRLTHELVSGGTQFTPDGSSILFTTGSRPSELRTVPVAGGASKRLIGGVVGWDVSDGSLSPDGSLVTFLVGELPGPARRWVGTLDGTATPERRRLPACASTPAATWSPDGDRIVCARGGWVVVVDISTGEATAVSSGAGAIWLDDHTLLVEA